MNIPQVIPPTRTGTVNGHKICVYDDLVPKEFIDQIFDAISTGRFTRSEIARPDTAEYKHWALELDPKAMMQSPLHAPSLMATKPFEKPGEKYRIYRAYCNHAAYGDMLFTHTDCLPEAHDTTALWYICKQWDPEWGGETIFFNDEKDAEFICSPRPGRLVVFDGRIPHCGRPPSRICYQPRLTLAFKLEPVAS